MKGSINRFCSSSLLKSVVGVFAIAGLFAIAAPRSAEAIPAYARLYKTECTTCHTIYPMKNEFGDAFEKNGYVWPAEKHAAVKDVTQVSESEKKANEMYSLTGLPSIFPISLSLRERYTLRQTGAKGGVNFNSPGVDAEVVAGAPLFGDKFSFFTVLPVGEGPEEVFIVARKPLNVPINVRFGKFESNIAMKKHNDRLGNGAASAGNLELNGFALNEARNAIEVNSIVAGRLFVDAGVVDRVVGNRVTGTSLVPTIYTDATGSPIYEPVDDTVEVRNKEYYGHVMYKIGGADYHAKEPDVDLSKESIMDFLSLTLGAFVYNGKTLDGAGDTRDFSRTGLEAVLEYKRLILGLGQQQAVNKTATADLKSTGTTADVTVMINSKTAVVLAYSSVSVDGGDKEEHTGPALVYAPVQTLKFQLYGDTKKTKTTAGAIEGSRSINAFAQVLF